MGILWSVGNFQRAERQAIRNCTSHFVYHTALNLGGPQKYLTNKHMNEFFIWFMVNHTYKGKVLLYFYIAFIIGISRGTDHMVTIAYVVMPLLTSKLLNFSFLFFIWTPWFYNNGGKWKISVLLRRHLLYLSFYMSNVLLKMLFLKWIWSTRWLNSTSNVQGLEEVRLAWVWLVG